MPEEPPYKPTRARRQTRRRRSATDAPPAEKPLLSTDDLALQDGPMAYDSSEDGQPDNGDGLGDSRFDE